MARAITIRAINKSVVAENGFDFSDMKALGKAAIESLNLAVISDLIAYQESLTGKAHWKMVYKMEQHDLTGPFTQLDVERFETTFDHSECDGPSVDEYGVFVPGCPDKNDLLAAARDAKLAEEAA